jgi:hypothetical protein
MNVMLEYQYVLIVLISPSMLAQPRKYTKEEVLYNIPGPHSCLEEQTESLSNTPTEGEKAGG